MHRVNFDYAAAAPLAPEAYEAMKPFLTEHFGNPQSIHSLADKPREAMETARSQVAALVNASPSEMVFTSCASESNNLAIKGLIQANRESRRHIVVSSIEHQSVLRPVEALAKAGFEVTRLGVDEHGLIRLDELESAIRPDTALVSVMHANNEIGTIEPLAEIAEVCRKHKVLLHSDGTAAVGRMPVDVNSLGCDSYSFAAQSFYGPKGAAALYLKTGIRPRPLIEGGVQEKGRRAGTEDVPAIVGMGEAAAIALESLPEWSDRMTRLGRRMFAELPKRLERIILTGHPENRLPGHVSLCVEFVEGEGMLLFLDDNGIAVASGSACTAKTLKASHVLLAIGLPHAIAQSSLMLTMSKDTTDEEVDYFLAKLPPIVERLRKMSPLYAKLLKGEDPYETKQESCNGGH